MWKGRDIWLAAAVCGPRREALGQGFAEVARWPGRLWQWRYALQLFAAGVRGEGEVRKVEAEDKRNRQIDIEQALELHGGQDPQRGFGRKEKEEHAANQHHPSNQCDQDGQDAAGPDVVREDNGKPAGERDNGEDHHGRTIAEERGNGRESVLPLGQEPKAGDQREKAEEPAEEYGERFHDHRILQQIELGELLLFSRLRGINLTRQVVAA